MLSLLKRYRELLVVSTLLIYPFGAFLTQGGRGREPNVLDRALLALMAPVQRGLTAMVDGAVGALDAYVALRGVREENQALRQETTLLKAQLVESAELRSENERLRRALAYSERQQETEVLARVVGFNPVAGPHSVRIDRGESEGIREGMAVVTPDGVVGQVIRTTGGTADVALLTDPQTRAGVRVQRSRARATVAGAGASRPLRLDNALRTDDIVENDLLVTSGADGVFPAGLLVGKVTNLSRTEHGVFQVADILPVVDMTKLEEVMVITSMIIPEREPVPEPPPPPTVPVPTAVAPGAH
ncbi:MAG: rod shape-determining protein MreC [Myxococcaceae bacterium]|nr:rod shape-determining protein MreC [Myxococcaceae bacterium]MCI0672534.1 rod shape-determining protein MreC [Myxococcaceae bacterium]